MQVACLIRLTLSNAVSEQGEIIKTGVDVMITIFCDFWQFSAKKLAFLSKTKVIITIFAKTSSSLSKN
jgi:hypothetical protein